MSYGSLLSVSCELEDANFRKHTVLRRAFAAHVVLVAKALHHISKVDAGDYGEGDEDQAIRACLQPGVELEQATNDLRAAMAEAEQLLKETRA